ncbi:MAG: ABC transporter ATP-binding protein [Burkholderiales bacterium]
MNLVTAHERRETASSELSNEILPLVLDGVCKRFRSQSVLNHLTLSVPRGQIIGLLGRNGVGKTTMIECALGLREINAGRAFLFGDPAHAPSTQTRGKIGYVPQQSDLFEWMTVSQMLSYFKAFYTRWNTPKVEGLLDRWSIGREQSIASLSGGQKQRLAIIRALAHDPELLILDEPVASLDPAGRRDFLRELIDTSIDRGTTVLFSTHILSDLERVAVDLAILKEGAVILQDTMDAIAESVVRVHGNDQSLMLVPAALVVSRRAGNMDGIGPCLIARLDQTTRAMLSTNTQLRIEAMSLEDLFIEVTQ